MSYCTSQYWKFGGAKTKPAVDLLNRTVVHIDDLESVHSVLDLGCGTGHLTEMLCRTFPSAHVEGIDSSSDMIIHALRDNHSSELKERMSFRVTTAETESVAVREKYDVVYSNATLHWCVNHETLLPNIIHNLIKPNGVLAIQMPDTRLQASHLLMLRAAENMGVYDKVKDVRIPRSDNTPEWYFNLLRPLVKEIELWTTEYVEQLTSEQMPTSPCSYTINHLRTLNHVTDSIPGTPKEVSVDCMHNDTSVDTTLQHPVYEHVHDDLKPYIAALGGEDSFYGVQYVNEYNRLLYEAYPVVRLVNKITSFEEYVTLMPYRRQFIVCKL